MPLLWKVIAVLETIVKLWVLAAVNDGASPTRKFFALHSKLGGKLPDGLVYKTPNLFHLVRMIDARNCLYNSGYGSHSGCMWNDGQYLVFRFVLYILKLKRYLFFLILGMDNEHDSHVPWVFANIPPLPKVLITFM